MNQQYLSRTSALGIIDGVANYGLQPDGVSDNTARFEVIKQDVGDNRVMVYLKPGAYKVSPLLTIPDNIELVGTDVVMDGISVMVTPFRFRDLAYNVDDFGAVGGDFVKDTAAVVAAVAAAPEGSTVRFTSGKTYWLTSVEITKRLHIDLNGANLRVNPSATGNPVFAFTGSAGTPYGFNAVKVGDITVTLSVPGDGANFAPGDYVRIGDSRIVPAWDGGAGYGGRHEINIVRFVEGDVLTLRKPVEWDYDTVQVISKLAVIHQPSISGGAYISEDDPGAAFVGDIQDAPHLFYFLYCVEPTVQNCRFDKWQLHCVNFDTCVNPEVSGCVATDPYRPEEGGHGYFMRFNRCAGGVARRSAGRKIRHMVDFCQTYDGHSENNQSIGHTNTAYYCHGLGSKRCSSAYDSASGVSPGWGAGNPTFGADYDFNIVNPKYYGTMQAISFGWLSVGMRVVNPEIHSTFRGVMMHTGADDLVISGGVIEVSTDTNGFAAVIVRPKAATSDPVGSNPKDVTIRNVDFRGAPAISYEGDGDFVCEDNRLDFSVGTTLFGIYVPTVIPKRVVVRNNRLTKVGAGVLKRGIYIEVTPTDNTVIENNHLDGFDTVGIRFPATANLRLIGNRMVNYTGGTEWNINGDLNAVRSGNNGARIAFNNPNWFDQDGSSYARCLNMGGMWMWFDAGGKLRCKNSAPANDTDGTVIGTQA